MLPRVYAHARRDQTSNTRNLATRTRRCISIKRAQGWRVRQSFVKLHQTPHRVNVSVCLASKPRGTARSVPAIHQALFPLYGMTTCISLNKIYSAIDHPAWSSGPSVCSTKETISRRMMMGRCNPRKEMDHVEYRDSLAGLAPLFWVLMPIYIYIYINLKTNWSRK